MYLAKPVPKALQRQIKAISALDFTNQKRKMALPKPEGLDWSEKQIAEAEKWYKRFLATMVLEPDLTQVPNGPIDEFWHKHILDTAAYHRDCEAIFGHYIHHYPYYGLNGDEADRDQDFDRTNEAYQTWFGEDCKVMTILFDYSESENGVECDTSPTVCASAKSSSVLAQGCGGKGSGTGCGQRCGRR